MVGKNEDSIKAGWGEEMSIVTQVRNYYAFNLNVSRRNFVRVITHLMKKMTSWNQGAILGAKTHTYYLISSNQTVIHRTTQEVLCTPMGLAVEFSLFPRYIEKELEIGRS